MQPSKSGLVGHHWESTRGNTWPWTEPNFGGQAKGASKGAVSGGGMEFCRVKVQQRRCPTLRSLGQQEQVQMCKVVTTLSGTLTMLETLANNSNTVEL